MILNVNHITLAVTNLPTSLVFYCDILGFEKTHEWQNGAYLEAGSVWVCLTVCQSVTAREDYTHIAFGTDDGGFAKFKSTFKEAGVNSWKENNSEGDSIYFLDPDGHKLEIHVGNLQSRMEFIHHQSLTWRESE